MTAARQQPQAEAARIDARPRRLLYIAGRFG